MHLYDKELSIHVGARSSKLSKIQVSEVFFTLFPFYPLISFSPIWVESSGDKDKKTSLRTLGKTDFFTKEIDEMLLQKKCRIAIHSAKDLPDPLPKGLQLIALTKGLDSSDCLVLRKNETLDTLAPKAKIGTSCIRREQMIKSLREDLECVDIRGTIEERLTKLNEKQIDGVVMAEAAIIRLCLLHLNRIPLKGETAPLQGQLAVLAREEDDEMKEIFSTIDAR
jgi:hydroxymethylbilane synthase